MPLIVLDHLCHHHLVVSDGVTHALVSAVAHDTLEEAGDDVDHNIDLDTDPLHCSWVWQCGGVCPEDVFVVESLATFFLASCSGQVVAAVVAVAVDFVHGKIVSGSVH